MSTPPGKNSTGREIRERRYLRIDLHRRRFTCCVRVGSGRTYLSEWNLEQLPEFVRKLRPTDEVAVEVTGNTRLFHEAVAPHVEREVVDPNQFLVISHSLNKTDPNDACNLALYLAKRLLPEVRMKAKAQAEVAGLTQTRDRLVKLRSALKNKVNNLLSARGIELEKEDLSSEKGLQRVLGHRLEGLAQVELEIIVEQIRSLNRNIRRLEESARKLPGYTHLTSIKGIGALGAGVLLSGIGDVKDFQEEGKVASYFGIVPRVQNSNQTDHLGHVTKRGTKLGRTTRVQCALIAKLYSPYLDRFYERIRARRGTGKAIIALARKFLGIVSPTLKNNRILEDFPNFVLAEATP